MSDRPADPAALRGRRLTRERLARQKAEAIAEKGLRDLFERQQEIQLLRASAEAANSARSVAEAMRSALEAICAFTKWPVGHYRAVTVDPFDDTRSATPTDIWYLAVAGDRAQALREAASGMADTARLAARVLETGAPVWMADLRASAPESSALPPDLAPYLGAAFGLPVLADRDVAAVLEFFAPSVTPDDHLLELFAHVGAQLGRVIERERAQAQTIDAYHDPLTRLPNRALFVRFVQRARKRQERYAGHKFAVLFIDLDKFKAINDSLGHRAGDELLLQIGQRLAESLRATDPLARADPTARLGSSENTVARLGGDEFTILLEDINDISDAIRVADRIHSALARPFTLESGVEVFAAASIGIAGPRPGHTSAEDVLQDADIAMYRAKGQGKRGTEVFDQEMQREAVARLQLETDLQRVLERGELALAYQPIVRLDTGRIVGFEALVRWQHAARGVLLPAEFIPIAEDTGTILDIGAWALAEACRQLHEWHRRFARTDLTVAVNLSAKQFGVPDLVADVARVLQAVELAPNRLCLELTETVAMEHAAQTEKKLWDLHELGVGLAIDDFGTGFSSLAYLTRFRVGSLKIDKSFVRRLGIASGETLVRTVLSLGTNLGFTVVAEGVESAEEAARLQALGCVFAQGYHFHRPLWPEEVERLFEQPPADK